jgi:EmrB/QacA subfamily drug resistance transporter
VFAVVGLAAFLAALDMFIVNIAVPAIRQGFSGTSVANVSWVMNAYAIVFAALLVPAGKLGDVVGRRRVFIVGLAAFGLGSALCAAAPTLGFLIGARVLQGAGAAAVTPTSLGLLLPSVPPARRAAAIGGWAAIGAVGGASGPVLGGLLTELSWHWIFIVNVPLTLIVLVASPRVLPEIRDPARPPLPDGPGTVILIAAVAAATLGLVQGPAWQWDIRVIGCFLGAAALAAVFTVRSTRHRSPVLDLAIVRVPAFALASLSATLFFASVAAMLLSNVLFLTGVWHYSVLDTGLALTPGAVIAAAFAPLAGRVSSRAGAGLVGSLGATLFALGSLLWILLIGIHPLYLTRFLPTALISGVGIGITLPAFTIAASATLPPQRLSTGIGALTMFRQIGGTLGVAAFVAILGTPVLSSVIGAYDATREFILAGGAATAVVLLLIRRPARAPRSQLEPRGMPSAAPAHEASPGGS